MDQGKAPTDYDNSQMSSHETLEEKSSPRQIPWYKCLTIMMQAQYEQEEFLKKK